MVDWHNNSHVRGGYSYQTIFSVEAKEHLTQPVNNVIFFAGETVSTSSYIGSVEAALQSGIDASERIISLDRGKMRHPT